jgi:hypothetical protein
VLRACKFQQGKLCNCDNLDKGFLVIFCLCFQPRKASFPTKGGHTCEEERESSRLHVWERGTAVSRVSRIGRTCGVGLTCEPYRPHV